MKEKHVDASREVRLWLGTIIVPVAALMVANPELTAKMGNKINSAKESVKSKLHRA